MQFKKKSQHPLAHIYGDDWAAEATRRIRWKEIEEQVRQHTRTMTINAPLSTEEKIFAKNAVAYTPF